MKADEGGTEPAEIGLPFRPDVEQAGLERQRDRKPGEDEIRGVVEREADRLTAAETADDERFRGRPRVDADRCHDETADHEGRGDAEERHQGYIGPTRQGAGDAHAGSVRLPCWSRGKNGLWATSQTWPSGSAK